MKNYIGFVNDHSGSMASLARAAIADSNTLTGSIRDAANTEMLDSVVSRVGFGFQYGAPIQRQVVISNPHVLKPVTGWACQGMTPMLDALGDMIELHESLPDYGNPDVSFLMFVTTDGQENASSKYNWATLGKKIKQLQDSGRWTFVFRVPQGSSSRISRDLGIPAGNVQEWETTVEGMQRSTAATQAAVSSFYAGRTAGARSSSAFYATAAAVDISALTDITKEVSLYVVPDDKMGIEIRDFVLTKRMKFLKGAAFYQLTKTESRVSHTKMIAIRARNTGKIFAGADARKMIGLPTDQNARLHPGDHGEYDIFIQSESVNRKLVAGTGVLYWEKIGVPFTEADLAYLKPKAPVAAAPAPVQLPAVAPTNRPTASPIPKARKPHGPHINGKPARLFLSREEARNHARVHKVSVYDLSKGNHTVENAPSGMRWFTYQ